MTETERLLVVASRERARTQLGLLKAQGLDATKVGFEEIDRKVYLLDDGPRTVVAERFQRGGKDLVRLRLDGVDDGMYEFSTSRWLIGEPLGYVVLLVLSAAAVFIAFTPWFQGLFAHFGQN
jgi:hypothetical protein